MMTCCLCHTTHSKVYYWSFPDDSRATRTRTVCKECRVLLREIKIHKIKRKRVLLPKKWVSNPKKRRQVNAARK